MQALRVCSLYPELMNIYADRGNIAILRARCEWRGIGFEHAAASLEAPLDPDAHDLFYIGGGQDRDQAASGAASASSTRQPAWRRRSTPTRTTSSTSAAGRTATRLR